jgi:hypothetical protein
MFEGGQGMDFRYRYDLTTKHSALCLVVQSDAEPQVLYENPLTSVVAFLWKTTELTS